MSDAYARFVSEEVLPFVLADAGVRAAYPKLRFTTDPWGRGTFGCSSGGAAAITMAYFRPDLFRRVAAFSPSLVDFQCATAAPDYPMGGREYYDGLRLLQTKAEPLRIHIENAEFDLGGASRCCHPPQAAALDEPWPEATHFQSGGCNIQ